MWNVVPVLCAACPGALVCPSSWGKRTCRVASLILIQLPRTLCGRLSVKVHVGGRTLTLCPAPRAHTASPILPASVSAVRVQVAFVGCAYVCTYV